MSQAMLNDDGTEFNDGKPVAVPVRYKRPPTLQEEIARMVRTRISEHAMKHGRESFEQADDFSVGDDYDPRSPYEETFDPLHTVTKEQEIRSGFVEEIPAEDRAAAREIVDKVRASRGPKKSAPAAPAAPAPAEPPAKE